MNVIDIPWIKDTPLAIRAYNVTSCPTQLHKGILEIIYCLKGCVKFSYIHEEFNLEAGEFISVDNDAFFLYSEEDNICISFYFDLKSYKKKHPFILDTMFVCEGTKESKVAYPTQYHEKLKGMLLATFLIHIEQIKYGEDSSSGLRESLLDVSSRIVELMVRRFNIIFYYTPNHNCINDHILQQYNQIVRYLHSHLPDKLALSDLSKELNLSTRSISSFLGKYVIGFRKIVAYYRINLSQQYLISSNLTIAEISEACGFSNAKYFYQAFKYWFNCTPKEFRMKYLSERNDESITIELEKYMLYDELVQHILDHFVKNFGIQRD